MKNQSTTLIKFPVASFRKVTSPSDERIGKMYVAIVNIKDLPQELENWRDLNPRHPNPNSGVAKKIFETLENQPELFLLRNRGITVISENLEFDNQGNVLKLEMIDKSRNGLLDGGHTFKVIRDYIDGVESSKLSDINTFVKLEILEGVQDINDVVSIVEARNTSTQVKEKSIEELLHHYDEIKKVLSGKPYADHIAYKEYELLEDGSKKNIDLEEILSYLICFDIEAFDKDRHPIKAYSAKKAVIDHFKNREKNGKEMSKYIALLPEILELHDIIYKDLPEAYNSIGGKFGKLTGVMDVTEKPINLVFSGETSDYRIPSGFIYPVLASFRTLVKVENGKCSWKANPVNFFKDLKEGLATRLGEQAREFRNPNKLGKDTATWGRCYDLVEREVLVRHL